MTDMLEGFYEIMSSRQSGPVFGWRIRLNVDHEIFRVHFPGTPITPGACQFEIFRQLAEKALGVGLAAASIKNLKYLQIIDPQVTREIEVSEEFEKVVDTGEWKASVTVKSEDVVFTKASLTFKEE